MIAGAGPVPLIPSSRRKGSASLNFDIGAISTPKSAIDGIVCTMPRLAKTKPFAIPLTQREHGQRHPDDQRKDNCGADESEMAQELGCRNDPAFIRKFPGK